MKFPSGWKLEAKKTRQQAFSFDDLLTSKQHVGTVLDMSAEHVGQGKCPVSGEQMIRCKAGPHEVWVSPDERIVLPLKD